VTEASEKWVGQTNNQLSDISGANDDFEGARKKNLQAERAKKICTPMLTGHVIFDASAK